MVYSGHQFGISTGPLSDGRALLITEQEDSQQMKWECLHSCLSNPYIEQAEYESYAQRPLVGLVRFLSAVPHKTKNIYSAKY